MNVSNQFGLDFDSGEVVSPELKELKDEMSLHNVTYDPKLSLDENKKNLEDILVLKKKVNKLEDKMKTVNLEYNPKLTYQDNLDKFNLKVAENRKAKQEEERIKREKAAKHVYPFILHYAGRDLDVSHIFEEEKDYTDDEITTKMLEHRFYEFSGKVSYKFIKEDNVLIPIFQQHKKG